MSNESLFTQFRYQRRLLGPSILVNHLMDGETVPFLEYLSSRGETELPEIFTPDSSFVVSNKELVPNFYDLSPESIWNLVSSRITDVQDAVDVSLRNIVEDGFNKHGIDHVSTVSRNSLMLLRQFGVSDLMTMKRAVISGLGHDIGALKSRKIHSIVSPFLLKEFVPEIAQDRGEWRRIRKAIYLHNPPVFEAYLDGVSADIVTENLLTTPSEIEERLIERLRSTLEPEVFTTIIADTTDIRTGRATDKPGLDKSALDRNRHLALTLNTDPSYLGIDAEDNRIFRWDVNYVTEFTSEELAQHYSQYAEDIDKPDQMHVSQLYSEFGEGDEFLGWFKGFIDTHGGRFGHVALSAFVLDSELEAFQFSANYKGRKLLVEIKRPDIAGRSISEQVSEMLQIYRPSPPNSEGMRLNIRW